MEPLVSAPMHSSNTAGKPERDLTRSIRAGVMVFVLVALGVWGHQTGWRFFGNASDQSHLNEDDPVIVRSLPRRGWCPAHGVHDCPLEHPDTAELDEPYQVTQADLDRTQHGLAVRPRNENDNHFPEVGRRIRFPSRQAIEKRGIDTDPAQTASIIETIKANGEIQFDPSRVARVTARAAGVALFVAKDVGDVVAPGDVLAVIDAAEIGRQKAEFLQALVQVRLKRKIWENLKPLGTSVPERQLREAEAAFRDAESRIMAVESGLAGLGLPIRAEEFGVASIEDVSRRLQLLGIPSEMQSRLGDQTTSNLLPVRAPQVGVVLTRSVIAGESVDTMRPLFVIVDPTKLWVTLHVPANEVRWLNRGMEVRFTPDGQKTEFTTTLSWIGTAADAHTRAVPVRADIANPDGRLRASTLGAGRVVLRREPNAVLVPSDAVHQFGNTEIVFVRQKQFYTGGPKEFIVRTVRTGIRDGGQTEIIAGVLPGEVVATKGSMQLVSALKSSRGVEP